MSKKCSVRPLQENALARVANLVVETLCYAKYAPDVDLDVDVVLVVIQEYLECAGATSNIYQDLLRVILSSDYLEAHMRLKCLQLLLNPGVSLLVTDVFPFSYYERVLQVIAEQGRGLRVLNLKGVWIKEEHMQHLFEVVKNCTYLNKLYVPYIASDDLLEFISKHSSELQVLEITGETDITEIGIDALSKGICCEKLKIVDVGMPGEENICFSDIALLLENCPNLETLATYSYVGAALKFVHDNIDENFKCKLRYIHDTATDNATMAVIAKTCPVLESLYLDTPKAGGLQILKDLRLRKLKLYKFDCDELCTILQSIGKDIHYLTLINGTGDLEIGQLARLCPSLNDLECYMMGNLKYLSYNNYFRNLEGLELLSSLSMMSHQNLQTLICKSTSLKRLAIDSVDFSDEDMLSIFAEHHFPLLEDLWFTLAPRLTVKTIENLMDLCPELQSIGQLSGWDLTPDDLALMRGILKSSNSGLILTPHGFFP